MNNVDNTGYIPTVVAFCAGYGGIERGLDLAGVEHRVVAYVEIEAFAVANLVKKMEDGLLPPAPIWTDIKTFPSQLFRGTVDLITGGYPCQPFSAAGKRKGADDPRHLWPFISHHIGIMRPRRVFFENVEGHISLGLNTVLADLEDRGFDTTWGIFSAREVGAPHQRKRVYIMGDAEHNGPHGTALARSLGASICNDEKGEDETRESEGASPSSELADTLDAGFQRAARGSSTSEEREPVYILGNSECEGLEGLSDESGENQKRREEKKRPTTSTTSTVKSKQLADTRCSASTEGQQPPELRPTRVSESSPSTWQGSRSRADEKRPSWPAGPGTFQYEWEEPRTVWKTKPELGGSVDGVTDRVDRIRLLGNGVVPQTAAKAWQVLDEELLCTP